ncbi:MAG: nucleotidyltransferase family protein [Candidatus Rehaiarchaeum fermentans]|nr:nucleotidyltransferase family protein [Candidatus Rehaiarchaeum fermentans]MCW1302474.1 nucleotidyltransferase family protein [Candidatus Rehaiarchaeum fermentans]
MEGLIIARGKGSRMKYFSVFVPKILFPLVTVEERALVLRPMLDFILKRFEYIGVEKTTVLTTEDSKLVEDYCVKAKLEKVYVYFAPYDVKPRGFGGSLLLAKGIINSDFILSADDNLFDPKIYKMGRELFEKEGADALLIVHRVSDPSKYGVIVGNLIGKYNGLNEYEVKEIVEKPKQYISDIASSAVYFFKPTVFEALSKINENQREIIEIPEAISHMIKNGRKVIALESKIPWLNTGEVDHYIIALETTYKMALKKLKKLQLLG